MKCLVCTSIEQNAWLKRYFPGLSPYLLPVCKKPLAEYYIDFCVLNDIHDIRLLSDGYSSKLRNYFGSGEKWGVTISYGLYNPDDELSKIVLKNSSFIQDDDVFIIQGNGFMGYDKSHDRYDFFHNTSGNISMQDNGASLVLLKNTEEYINTRSLTPFADKSLSVKHIDSITSYYEVNMDILQNTSDRYVLPGYNNEEGVYIGRNVVIPRNVTIHKPVILGNDIQLKPHTEIGPNVILDDNIIVDEGTTIHDSIIFKNSYIGSNLEISEKIVCQNHLIAPDMETIMDIREKFFLAEVQDDFLHRMFRQGLHIVFAGFIFLVQAIPFILLRPFCGLKAVMEEFFINQRGDSAKFLTYTGDTNTLGAQLFYRFSLDKFVLLQHVFTGKLFLAGNYAFRATPDNKNMLQSYPLYYPSVFEAGGEAGTSTDIEEYVLADLDYLSHRNIIRDLKIVFAYVLKRLFTKMA